VARKSAKNRKVSTEGFIDAIAERLQRNLGRKHPAGEKLRG